MVIPARFFSFTALCGAVIPGYVALLNTEFSAVDEISIISGAASPKSCAETCAGISSCAGFSYSKHMETCWLRSSFSGKHDSHHLDFYHTCSVETAPVANVQATEADVAVPVQQEETHGRSLGELSFLSVCLRLSIC